MQPKIKTVIVDDHDFFRETLKNYLKSIQNIDIAGEAKNGKEAFELVGAISDCEDIAVRRPLLLVIMDINMPIMDGIKACENIKKEKPETKVILYSMHDIEMYCKNNKILADTYIPKDKLFDELPEIIFSYL